MALAEDLDRRRRLRHYLWPRLRVSAFVDREVFASDVNATLKAPAKRHVGKSRIATVPDLEPCIMTDDTMSKIDGVAHNWADP